MAEGRAEGRLLRRRLRARVDELPGDGGVFGPGRNQPPAEHGEATPGACPGPRFGVGGTDDRDVLARGDVVAGPQVERRADEIHPLVQLPPGHALGEATAHSEETTRNGGRLSSCSRNVLMAAFAAWTTNTTALSPGRPRVHHRKGAAQGGARLAEEARARRPRPAQAGGAEGHPIPGALRHTLLFEGAEAGSQHARPLGGAEKARRREGPAAPGTKGDPAP